MSNPQTPTLFEAGPPPVPDGDSPAASFLAELNPSQLEAVTHSGGHCLVLAGAGSGKPRVLTPRTAWPIAQHGIDPDQFEFQMIHGIGRKAQQRLRQEGYAVRVYVPFGTEWAPYFVRRLAERPANFFFLLKHLLRN